MRAKAAAAAASPSGCERGVEDDADERAHVGRARLDTDRRRRRRRGEVAGPNAGASATRNAAASAARVRRREAPPPTASHSVTPGIGTGGVAIGPHSSFFGSRLGIASACSQVTTPPW